MLSNSVYCSAWFLIFIGLNVPLASTVKTLHFSFVMSKINFDTVNKSEYQETKYSRSSLLPQRALSYNMAVYFGEQHSKIKLDVLIYLAPKVILSINLNQIKDRTPYVTENGVVLVNPVWLPCSGYCLPRSAACFYCPLSRSSYWRMWLEECISQKKCAKHSWILLAISLFSTCIWEASCSTFEDNHRF